ncbi:response regulator [Subsaximicrobium wynnwilliamsii]|uniref:Response regulator n=1 Tax=Subsaximicrobium wynnwilliamsii TaxID=291179 RepID=A0A5C6ZFR7_9FLAO|nr:response regulator [Subsaximicrobium wynnwilliamsii]TXD84095.1 response regulator [Subsaximicrobium wynnwilliamsii]TXD88947.1 response regulator [Subsaximicrobium wynnwilliamsii]TXE03807.1 response regulator [Subsaximicrobium wynnwilliamsii]
MPQRLPDYSEKLSVLIIEDNQGDFVLIEDYLLEKFKSIEIIHFTNFANSIDYLQNPKTKVSLILMDLHLPCLKGIELINTILAYNFHIPVVILTGYSDIDLAKKSLQIGVYDYLIKDEINPVILHKTIIYALNRSSFINQIEAEKSNYENLFNFSPQPTWLLDSKSLKIRNANDAAQKKYGYSLTQFLEMSFTQLFPIEEEELIKHKLISQEYELNSDHFTHFLSNGEEIKVDIYFREINGRSTHGLIVQSNDVSKTLQHISTIEVQNEKLRKIAWTQSHMVRAPLARILGIINVIEMEKMDADELLFYLKQLRVSGNEMDEIIRKIVNETNHIEKQ